MAEGEVDGTIGRKPIDANTESDYRWRLSRHLLPFFGDYRLDEIDRELCVAFKAHKLARRPSCARRSRPAPMLRDRRGRRLQPLGPASIRKLHRHARGDPRRGGRGRAHRPQPGARPAHAGAGAQAVAHVPRDGRARRAARRRRASRTLAAAERAVASTAGQRDGAAVARLAGDRGKRPSEIAAELGLAQVDRQLPPAPARRPTGRRLRRPPRDRARRSARSGVRVSELCDLRIARRPAARSATARASASRTPRPRPASARCR